MFNVILYFKHLKFALIVPSFCVTPLPTPRVKKTNSLLIEQDKKKSHAYGVVKRNGQNKQCNANQSVCITPHPHFFALKISDV